MLIDKVAPRALCCGLVHDTIDNMSPCIVACLVMFVLLEVCNMHARY